MLVFAFRSEIWIVQNFNFTVFEGFCLSLSWIYRFLQNVNHAKVQSKTNKYCKFHVDLTRRRLSKSRFKKLGMVPKKLCRNTLKLRQNIRSALSFSRSKDLMFCIFSVVISAKFLQTFLELSLSSFSLMSILATPPFRAEQSLYSPLQGVPSPPRVASEGLLFLSTKLCQKQLAELATVVLISFPS